MAGQGTVGLEIVEDVPDVDVVVVPIGGGGLISGIATAVKGTQPEARVIGVEPEPRTRAARQPSTPVGRDGRRFDRRRAQRAVRRRQLRRGGLRSTSRRVLVTETEIEDAIRFLYARAKLACEPAGAAAAAALLAGKVPL